MKYSENNVQELTREITDVLLPVGDRLIRETKNNNRLPYEYEVDMILREYEEQVQETILDNIYDYYLRISELAESRIQTQEQAHKTDTLIREKTIMQANKDKQTIITDYLQRKKRNIQNTVQSNLNQWLRQPLRQITRITRTGEELFEYEVDHAVIEFMTENTFIASESIMERVTQNIYDLLREEIGEQGKGIDAVTEVIQEEFPELVQHEAQRIARTETLKAQNDANYQRLRNNETVEYKQWVATDDERTRDSHSELNGQITYIDGFFDNGLEYPGDTSGDIEEWVNCRCDMVAYYPEVEYVPPPGESSWYEDDWVINPVFNDFLEPELGYEISIEY